MKKILSLLMAAVMTFGALSAVCFADGGVNVNVCIADSNGSLVLAMADVLATDTDNDGKITIRDALYCAHEEYYVGGAAAGYGTENTIYGISMTKLWGETNSGSFGYYLNNASALSLADSVNEGDKVYAFAYTDETGWSDTYSYFSEDSINADQYGSVELTLYSLVFDLNEFTYSETAVSGASITVDGKATGYVTDENGKVTIEMNDSGSHIVSASSSTMTLVPPACVIDVQRADFASTLRYYFNKLVNALTAFIAQFIGG